jgi:DNA-binding NarL/FixJ family response regulator
MTDTLRILLVDDHEVVRLGLRSLLARHSGFEVVAEASTETEAVEMAEAHRPDVVLMDIRLAGGNGVAACEAIMARLPETKVIMLTSFAEDELLFAAIRAGAAGYVLKQVGSGEVIRAIEAVGRGDAVLDPSLTQRVFQEMRRSIKSDEASYFDELTAGEKQVLLHIAEGKTNREIGAVLYLSEGTVRNYVSNVFSKLGVSNRAEAAAYAIQHNLRDFL